MPGDRRTRLYAEYTEALQQIVSRRKVIVMMPIEASIAHRPLYDCRTLGGGDSANKRTQPCF